MKYKRHSAFFLLFCMIIVQSLAMYQPHEKNNERNLKQLNRRSAKVRNNFALEQPQHISYDALDKIYDDALVHSNDIKSTHTVHTSQRAEGDRKKRELSDWLIAPNTRWCGRGNLANGTYNALGGANAADKCCRKHDHCPLFIPAMSNRYELFNYRPYTLSHCHCDRRFRTCLKMANDEDAKTIGKLFFNMVQTQCFILHNEKICQKRAADGTCMQESIKQKAYLKNNRKF